MEQKKINIFFAECPPPVPVLAIVLGVIAGIVLIGLLLLLCWKLLTILHDRREYAKFERERLNAKWDTVYYIKNYILYYIIIGCVFIFL